MKKLIDNSEEIVKDIIGFEGLYKITSKGRIIRLKRKKRLNNGKFMDLPEIDLKISSRINYPTVALNKNGKQHTFLVHRLIAIHFVHNDNPLIKNEVNHKNKNIFDYSVENLEWCSRSENMIHAKQRP